jgi:hypothetical protein
MAPKPSIPAPSGGDFAETQLELAHGYESGQQTASPGCHLPAAQLAVACRN